MYRCYDLNISIMMLGITLSIHNNENCYIYVLKRSIFRQVYYYPAMLTVFNNNAFASHTIHTIVEKTYPSIDPHSTPPPPVLLILHLTSYLTSYILLTSALSFHSKNCTVVHMFHGTLTS